MTQRPGRDSTLQEADRKWTAFNIVLMLLAPFVLLVTAPIRLLQALW